MKSYVKLAGIALLAATAATSSVSAESRGGDRGWERLGCERVGNRTDYDEIRVGRKEGRFSAIRLEAKGNSVSILDLKVVYANGAPDDISVRSEINENDSTRPLDLRGRDRAIRSIQIVSKKDFKGPGRGKASVCVYGKEA
jgi:hypothetical protein